MSKNGTSISYTYNEDGLRVGKNVNGTTTSYVLHGKNVVHLTQGSNNLHFFYGADGSPAIVEYNGVNYGYARNLQGDIIAIIRGTGEIVVQYTYDAWGKPTSKTGSMADTLGTLNPFRYRGYVYDEETGLYYLQTRYYSPVLGRFISADIEIGNNELLAHNIFTYCLNIPTSRIDCNGSSSYAIGSVYSGSFGGAASFASGYCWDDEGNFGAYYTFVGMDYDIEQIRKSPTIGLGGFSASAGFTYQVYPNKTIKDIVGPGTYYGMGGDVFGHSLGIDAINTLNRDETFADTIRDNRAPDGYQYSINMGIGFELAHAGTSNTYIMLIFNKGKYIPPWKRKMVNSFPVEK